MKKAGAWYTYEGEQLGQGRENARKFLKEHNDVAEQIYKRVIEKLGLVPTDVTGDEAEPGCRERRDRRGGSASGSSGVQPLRTRGRGLHAPRGGGRGRDRGRGRGRSRGRGRRRRPRSAMRSRSSCAAPSGARRPRRNLRTSSAAATTPPRSCRRRWVGLAPSAPWTTRRSRGRGCTTGERREFGVARLRAELRRRLVPEPLVDAALAALEQRDDRAAATELAERRVATLPASLDPPAVARRLQAYLVRRGYRPRSPRLSPSPSAASTGTATGTDLRVPAGVPGAAPAAGRRLWPVGRSAPCR